MDEKTKNILNINSVTTTKTLLDKRHEDLDITWINFIEIVKTYGFKSGYCQKFTGTGWSDKGIEEEEVIFFHEEKGLILYAESYDRKSVNSAKVYGEVKIGNKLETNQLEALICCSHCNNGNGTISFNVDVRENLRFQLDALSKAFEFSKNWSKVPFLWFLNYMDNKDENYKEINKRKIDESTPEVHKIIFG